MSAADGIAVGGALGFGAGARSAATSLLRTLACDAVVLRMPQPPIANNDGEELGLGSPQFTQMTMTPALVQQHGVKTLVTVSAEVLETALGVSDAQAVEDAVSQCAFALVSDRALQVEQVERREVFGRAYLYRLLLATPKLG